MDSSRGKLTPLQWTVLRAFFEREKRFFLTGGAALAGFHLGHRATSDLDLFTMDAAAHSTAAHVLADVAEQLGGTSTIQRHGPGFARFLIQRGEDGLIVDVVHERVAQSHPVKQDREGISVDPPEEILANKLTTILSRSEERDLVDVMMLERAGYPLKDALDAAAIKDGGCTPAQLAYVLSDIRIPDGISLPGGVRPDELRDYVSGLIKRLRRAALPRR